MRHSAGAGLLGLSFGGERGQKCRSAVQVRTKNFTPVLDMSGCNALRLRVKGDGLRYKVTIRTDSNWDGIGYIQ